MMETLERRLEKLGQVEAANEVFNKMIANGALDEISATPTRHSLVCYSGRSITQPGEW